MTQTLVTDRRIESFCDKLEKRGRNVDRIRALCLGERNFLKSAKYSKSGNGEGSTLALATRHGYLTRYRNAIRDRFGPDHPALRYMVLSDDEQNERNAADRVKVIARHTDRRALQPEEHVTKIIETLVQALYVHPLKLAAALIAATGRRPVEILRTGDLKLVAEPSETLFAKDVKRSSRYTMLFSGQAKTKSSDNEHAKPYEIPVLVQPNLILEGLTILRRRYPVQHLTTKQVSDRTSKEIGKRAKELFEDSDDPRVGIGPSELRAAYATIAYEWYASAAQSWNAYTARILGHSEWDLVTSFSYDRFYPLGSKRDYDRSVQKATRETLDKLLAQRKEETDPRALQYVDSKISAVRKRLRK